MTFLGKCFTAAILFLSIAFMILALVVNASHRNWREVVIDGVDGQPGLKTQIESLSRVNQQLEDERRTVQSTLDREQASRRTALASLQTQLDQLRQELETSEAAVQSLTAKTTELTQVDNSRVKQLEQLQRENTELQDSLRSEREKRDELFSQNLTLTDELNQVRGLKLTLEERNRRLSQQLVRYQEVVDSKGIDINEPLDGAPPERNGKVVQVNRPNRLALVSIGYDDGLRSGHFLDVTRNNRYVGKLRVTRTEPDRSVAEILEDYSEGILQEGDRVDTSYE